MKRKLVKQGAATMMISLPAKWVRDNGLDKGDEVDLIEENNLIKIGTDSKEEKNVTTINVSGLGIITNRVLMSYYIRGVDELEVIFTKPEEIKDFQKRIVNELLGFEIIEQRQNKLVIKDITGTDKQDINNIIKRIFFILDSMGEELISGIENKHDLSPIIEIDISVNKFVNFCLRNLNKHGYTKYRKTTYFYGIVSALEEIGDLYKKMAEKVTKKEPIQKDELNNLKEIKFLLKDFEKLLFNFNKIDLVNFAKNYKNINEKISRKSEISTYLHELADTIIRMNNNLMVMNDF
jgi:phosphate uptake regulator